LSPQALDLIDLAGVIYRVESQIPSRPTNPAREWQVTAPVRVPNFWRNTGGPLLASALAFLNRAQWTFTFTARAGAPLTLPPPDARRVRQIILFSGGMDSACGAGVHKGSKRDVQLVCFSTTNLLLPLQRKLAEELGHFPPTQWRLVGRRGKEGMNLIRALMFLSLGAAVASSFDASEIFQYENGVLACAIPPTGNFVSTRHAHPELHRRLERLFAAVFGQTMTIVNPFALLTKRETADRLSSRIGAERAEAILRQTQTCWRLSQAHVAGKKKKPGVPCGVCTPCIVRRTARPHEAFAGAWDGWSGYAFDLGKPSVQRAAKLGLPFRAYLELIDIAMSESNDRDLIGQLSPEARALIGEANGPSETETAALIRRFAREFCDCFGIRAEESSA
jgi:7-cyano-7-deazaguanine synthase in queuosine biosynthesis